MKIIFLILFAVSSLPSSLAHAAPTATVWITTATRHNGGQCEEAKDEPNKPYDYISFLINGPAVQSVYDAMKEPALPLGNGMGVRKTGHDLVCERLVSSFTGVQYNCEWTLNAGSLTAVPTVEIPALQLYRCTYAYPATLPSLPVTLDGNFVTFSGPSPRSSAGYLAEKREPGCRTDSKTASAACRFAIPR